MDHHRYWCKVLNNPEGARVLVTEHVVGRLGALIGIPVCGVELVRIPPDFVGWKFADGLTLEEGWAHGSLAIENATETHALDHRPNDDNTRRHAGIFALADWLCAADHQWLIQVTADNMYHSHDHGQFLPGASGWTTQSLEAARDSDFSLGLPTDGLHQAELQRLADSLEELMPDAMASAISDVPVDWPVTDDELEALVAFADYRRVPVAERLRALAAASS